MARDRWNSNWQQRSLRHLTGISCSFGKSAWCSLNDSEQSEYKEWGWRLWLWCLQKLIYLSSSFCSGGDRSFSPEICKWTKIRNHVPGSQTEVLNPPWADSRAMMRYWWMFSQFLFVPHQQMMTTDRPTQLHRRNMSTKSFSKSGRGGYSARNGAIRGGRFKEDQPKFFFLGHHKHGYLGWDGQPFPRMEPDEIMYACELSTSIETRIPKTVLTQWHA